MRICPASEPDPLCPAGFSGRGPAAGPTFRSGDAARDETGDWSSLATTGRCPAGPDSLCAAVIRACDPTSDAEVIGAPDRPRI
ncbi:hypothetical protein ACFWF7_14695 [Nocardia sp. NPDC060256]|uniref:hypothetical protein n=1 Tax=Nocardia sp. NPDC060256 TaxID=3347086 RepID=UPI0036498398